MQSGEAAERFSDTLKVMTEISEALSLLEEPRVYPHAPNRRMTG